MYVNITSPAFKPYLSIKKGNYLAKVSKSKSRPTHCAVKCSLAVVYIYIYR